MLSTRSNLQVNSDVNMRFQYVLLSYIQDFGGILLLAITTFQYKKRPVISIWTTWSNFTSLPPKPVFLILHTNGCYSLLMTGQSSKQIWLPNVMNGKNLRRNTCWVIIRKDIQIFFSSGHFIFLTDMRFFFSYFFLKFLLNILWGVFKYFRRLLSKMEHWRNHWKTILHRKGYFYYYYFLFHLFSQASNVRFNFFFYIFYFARTLFCFWFSLVHIFVRSIGNRLREKENHDAIDSARILETVCSTAWHSRR